MADTDRYIRAFQEKLNDAMNEIIAVDIPGEHWEFYNSEMQAKVSSGELSQNSPKYALWQGFRETAEDLAYEIFAQAPSADQTIENSNAVRQAMANQGLEPLLPGNSGDSKILTYYTEQVKTELSNALATGNGQETIILEAAFAEADRFARLGGQENWQERLNELHGKRASELTGAEQADLVAITALVTPALNKALPIINEAAREAGISPAAVENLREILASPEVLIERHNARENAPEAPQQEQSRAQQNKSFISNGDSFSHIELGNAAHGLAGAGVVSRGDRAAPDSPAAGASASRNRGSSMARGGSKGFVSTADDF